MKTGKYIENQINNLKQKHYYAGWLHHDDKELKLRWKRDKVEIEDEYGRINDNNDIINLINRFDGAVSFVEENVKVGHIEDGYNMALAFHKALIGLQKMSRYIDSEPSTFNQFFEISKEEVDELFNRLDSIASRMDEQNMRRAMRD